MNALRNYLRLSANEPFRIFFPIGMLLGLVGIALWPLFYAGALESYPLQAHFRLMAHGFLGSFVFGFLFTAGPRLLKAPRLPAIAVFGFLALTIAEAIAIFAARFEAADALFLAQMIALFGVAGAAFFKRGDLPPPGFVLAFAGLLAALAGSVLLLLETRGSTDALRYPLTRILLLQAFPALPLIGIGAFFFPKLCGGRNAHDLPENRHVTWNWLYHALRAFAVVVAFTCSVFVELMGYPTAAYLLRAASLGVYVFLDTPIFRREKPVGQQKLHLAICTAAIVASFAAIAFWPGQKTALLHGFFIVGVTGSIVLVATRVVLGHSGNFILVMKSKQPLLIGVVALALASAARILADFAPSIRTLPIIAAAILWIAIALAWLAIVAPKTQTPDPEDGC